MQASLLETAENAQKEMRNLSVTLNRYAMNMMSEADEKTLFNSQFFDYIALIDSSKTGVDPITLYGQYETLPTLENAHFAHLSQHKHLIFTDHTAGRNALYLLQGVDYNEQLLLAKINLDQWQQAINAQLILKQNQMLLLSSDTVLSKQFIDYVIKNRAHQEHQVNGYYIAQQQQQTTSTYDPLRIIEVHQPNVLSFIINKTAYSLGLFGCIVCLFSCIYLKTIIKKKIKVLESLNLTLPMDAYFSEYLKASAHIDNAILSGAKLNHIIETSIRAIQDLMHADCIGITLLDTEKSPTTTFLQANAHQLASLDTQIEASLINKLKSMTKVTCLKLNSQDYQFSASLANHNIEMLLCPLLNEGVLSGFIFAFKKRKPFNSNQNQSFQNIGQHISIALATIINNEKLYIKQYFDPVTELYNQHACKERLSQEFSAAIRRKTKVAVFHLKLLGYKKINETFGYSIGEQVLKESASRLKSNLRQSDIIASLGADDFVIGSSDIDVVTNANRLADKVTKLFETPIQVLGNQFHLSTAIGISIYPTDGMSADEMLNNALTAVSSAAEHGKNTFAFYEENLSANEKWRIHLEQDLRAELSDSNNNLFILYQPQVDPRTNLPVSAEALVRWTHPEYGAINTPEFITLAEETGLIIELGRYVRKAAFQQFVAWKKENIALEKISVNLSSYEIQRPEFIQDLEQVIALTGIQTNEIELEITESLLLEVSGNVSKNLKLLSEMGISIAIDDFGTGYSNLSYLGRLPFNILKIDRSFMHGVGLNQSANKVLTMMIEMAHHLGKVVCVEGVETDAQYEFLKMVGCDLIQGYNVSKPISSSDYVAFSKKISQPKLVEEITNLGQ